MAPTNLLFINVSNPKDAVIRSKDPDIRSHVASSSYERRKLKGPPYMTSTTAATTTATATATSTATALSLRARGELVPSRIPIPIPLSVPVSVPLGENKDTIPIPVPPTAILPSQWTEDSSSSITTTAVTATTTPEEDEPEPEFENIQRSRPISPPILRLIGGCRVDPFRSYPVPYRPILPKLVDHLSMAVDIPELDQPGNKGLLRSSWFPLVMSEASLFLVIMLLAASHWVSVHTNTTTTTTTNRTNNNIHTNKNMETVKLQILKLRYEAIRSINLSLTHTQTTTTTTTTNPILSDALVGAIAKMASYEAMFGSLESYSMHMQGLARVIELRGGLDSLGLNGLLRRIVVWIDTNSAFLNGWRRFFPGVGFVGSTTANGSRDGGVGRVVEMETEMEPNPGHFLGVS